MQISVWVPLWIGFACIAAGTSLTWVLPETLNYKRDDGSLNHQQQQEPIGNEGFYEELKATIHTSYSGLKLLVTDRRIAALLFCFFVHSIMTDADAFFIQYISKKFDFTIAAVCLTTNETRSSSVANLLTDNLPSIDPLWSRPRDASSCPSQDWRHVDIKTSLLVLCQRSLGQPDISILFHVGIPHNCICTINCSCGHRNGPRLYRRRFHAVIARLA